MALTRTAPGFQTMKESNTALLTFVVDVIGAIDWSLLTGECWLPHAW